VGITGRPARVRGFGPVVRRHTEILLHESATLRSRLLREHSLEDLLREIAVYDPSVLEADLVRSRARDLGYDLRIERVPVQFAVVSPPKDSESAEGDLTVLRAEVVRAIRERFSDRTDIVSAGGSGRFVAFRRSRSPGSRERDVDVAADCRRILDAIRNRHGLEVRAGIGPPAADLPAMQVALRDAADALQLGLRTSAVGDIFDIADLRTQQLLSSSPPRARERMVAEHLSALVGQADWPVVRETLIAWCTSGFNLVATAKALHVHRNTVIYRLAKFEQSTGTSPRDYGRFISAYLACLCDAIGHAPPTAD
jgi:carbohydrate diacid regulator